VCLLVFPHDISKTDAVRNKKRDTEIFHDESWKPIYFGVKRSKVKVTSHKNVAGMGLCCKLVAEEHPISYNQPGSGLDYLEAKVTAG